jgi:hypothetical protein
MIGMLIAFAVVVPARGQVASASLIGEVRDQLGARVPGVEVTARHELTGFSRSVLTGDDGSYRLDLLSPGHYAVSAEKHGFRTLTVQAVMLEVTQKGKLDLQLQVGLQQESITITADVPLVQADDATIGFRLETNTIRNLPLDGRNISSLVTLGPGAIPRQLGGFGHDIINDVQENRGGVALNPPINGARSTMNTYLLDGGMNTDLNTRAIVVNPPIESVQEFRVLSSLPSAEFAQSGGVVVDVVTKSGGQGFHGNLFEYVRHDALDALSLFSDPNLPRPVFRQSQFGGSLGGRMPLPSTFFFTTYEGLRGKAAKTSQNLVPDAALRSGDFRGRNIIYDPLNIDPVTGARQPFPNNIIPSNRIDPIARRFLETYEPLPNRPLSGAVNYLDSTPNQNTRDNFSGRIDHEFPNHSRLFGRYTINDDRNRLATAFPERPTQERVGAQQVVLGHSISGNSWVNEARLSFNRLKVLELPESAFQSDAARDLGITDFPSDPFNFGLPFFLVTNFNMVLDTPNRPQTQRDNLWNLSEDISFTRGARQRNISCLCCPRESVSHSLRLPRPPVIGADAKGVRLLYLRRQEGGAAEHSLRHERRVYCGNDAASLIMACSWSGPISPSRLQAIPTTARTVPAPSSTGKAIAACASTAFAPGLTLPVSSVCRLQVCTGDFFTCAMPAIPLPCGTRATIATTGGGMLCAAVR